MKLHEYIWSNKPSGLRPLTKDQYDSDFLHQETTEKAFEKAWATRNFEIELYWKRATYFWAVIASAFVGYFALVGSENYTKHNRFDHVEVYFVICIGFVLSVAWLLTNIGSKTWQRHWEVHVDLLEDDFTGPLYKTVHPQQTFSVSKINEIVSAVIVFVWLLLAVKYLLAHGLIRGICTTSYVNGFVVASTAGTISAVMSMVRGYGRGRFRKRRITMYRRTVEYESNDEA